MRAALLALLLAPAARAERLLVVLPEHASAPYQEALEGIRAAWTGELETATDAKSLPEKPGDVVIALGARAARRARACGSPVVVALAPSFRAPARRGLVRVLMTPAPEDIARRLAGSGVKRLLLLHSGNGHAEFARRAEEEARREGIEIVLATIAVGEDLPSALRRAGEADAVWLAPDPDLVVPETFLAVREFAKALAIPFFAPTPGLAKDGARPDLAASFKDCGRAAALAAAELAAGRPVAEAVHPAAAEWAAAASSVSPSTSPVASSTGPFKR